MKGVLGRRKETISLTQLTTSLSIPGRLIGLRRGFSLSSATSSTTCLYAAHRSRDRGGRPEGVKEEGIPGRESRL